MATQSWCNACLIFSASCTICVAEGIGSDKTLQTSSWDFNVSNTMQDLSPRKEKTNLNTVKLLHTSSYMMYMLQFSIQDEKVY